MENSNSYSSKNNNLCQVKKIANNSTLTSLLEDFQSNLYEYNDILTETSKKIYSIKANTSPMTTSAVKNVEEQDADIITNFKRLIDKMYALNLMAKENLTQLNNSL